MKALVLTANKSPSKGVDAVLSALESRGFRVDYGRAPAKGPWDLTIVWGGASEPEESRLVVNPVDAVKRSLSPSESALLLTWHGIPVASRLLPQEVPRPLHRQPDHEFVSMKVHVGDLRVLAVEEDPRGEPGLNLSPWKYQRIMEAACRAVYVLGLHFACVHLKVHPKGPWHVERVDPSPDVDEETGRAYGWSIVHLAEVVGEGARAHREATLGADPEFALATDEGRILYASRYLKHRGEVGYDRQSRERRGAVYPLAEIRPNPSPSPLVLAQNVERTLLHARKFLPTNRVKWMAGSNPMSRFPTGGHVHISGIPLSTPILLALDTYVAVPLMLLERRTRARQRRRKYGRLGDFRRKEHGGFEYRTLPSWLVSPAATRAALCLVKVVATEWPRLDAQPLRLATAVKEFYLGKKSRFRLGFHKAWRRILATPTGETYAYELAYIHRMVMSENEWNDDDDIKPAWW